MTTPDRFDVLVVGSGPAGMAAACAAAKSATVGLLDDNPAAGGQIWRGGAREASSRQGRTSFGRLADAQVTKHFGVQVVAAPEPGLLLAEADGRPIEFRYGKLILATGARERFLPLPGWTLPGVVGAGGLQALVKSGLPIEGKRVVIAGSGPLLLSVADYLGRKGAKVICVAEQASWGRVAGFTAQLAWLAPDKLLQGFAYRVRSPGLRYRLGCWPIAADGADHVESVTLRAGTKTWTETCDYLACGFGLVPNLELPRLLGCESEGDAIRVDRWQETSQKDIFCAGEVTGIGGADAAIVEGHIAGLAAVGENKLAESRFPARDRARKFARLLERAFALRDELRELAGETTILCRCEDVTLGSVRQFSNWRAAKLHTRCGMGPCQGRICGAAAQWLFGWKNETFRPPLFPVSVATLARKVEE